MSLYLNNSNTGFKEGKISAVTTQDPALEHRTVKKSFIMAPSLNVSETLAVCRRKGGTARIHFTDWHWSLKLDLEPFVLAAFQKKHLNRMQAFSIVDNGK